jgi:hypothetical protein
MGIEARSSGPGPENRPPTVVQRGCRDENEATEEPDLRSEPSQARNREMPDRKEGQFVTKIRKTFTKGEMDDDLLIVPARLGSAADHSEYTEVLPTSPPDRGDHRFSMAGQPPESEGLGRRR